MFLDREPMGRSVRQRALKRNPFLPVVGRYVHRVLRPEIEHPFPRRVFPDTMGVAENTLRDGGAEERPRFSVVRRLINIRVTVVLLVEVDGEVAGPGTEPRGLDVADRAARGRPRNVRRDVCPVLPAVAGGVDETVGRTGPDLAGLERGFGQGEDAAG